MKRCIRTALFTATAGLTAGIATPISAQEAPQNPETATPSNLEIIVTAQKRSEHLQDVPIPVSVLNAANLTLDNKTRLLDYFDDLPGLSVQPGNQSHQTVVIRGLTTGPGNPAVGVTVDDVPYGATSNADGSSQVPDFDPGDLKQIEVLRGPQGTLYGAASLGGLIKYETIDPSTEGLSGSVSGGISGIHGGDGVGYNGRGAVNVPVTDDVAVRVSGFYRYDEGWLDNPIYDQRGINSDRTYGGRISTLIRPVSDWEIKLSALYQQSIGGSTNDEHLDLGDQQQAYLPGSQAYTKELQAYSAIVKGKIGDVNLTSITGYNDSFVHDNFDGSFALGPLVEPLFGVDGFVIGEPFETKKFSQEVRADTSVGSHLDLQVGGFFTNEQGHYLQVLQAADAANGNIVGDAAQQDEHDTYREHAVFGTATLKLDRQFDIQFGGRESWIRQSSERIDTGPIVGVIDGTTEYPFIAPLTVTNASVFTYSVTPRLRINDDFMLYARAASGYRAGGVNTALGVPSSYKPDSTEDYEIGSKGDLFDKALTFDVSLYYINWKDLQLSLETPAYQGYTGNGAAAKSEGIEISLDGHPIKSLTVGGWIEINDAKLTEDLPASGTAVGLAGDRLPYSSPVSANVHASYQFPVSDHIVANVGGQVNFVDRREGTFVGTLAAGNDRQIFPSYTTASLSAGIKYNEVWNFSLYANNVNNSRGELSPGEPTGNSYIGRTLSTAVYRLRPFESGLTIARRF